jgi:ribose 5-phosphate isomerase B
MQVFVGADHAGFHLKAKVVAHLSKMGYDVEDDGDAQLNPIDDYPQFAYMVATKVLGSEDNDARGILLCGSGQGMVIAANRVRGIRAALCWSQDIARETRNDNDSNVLSIPTRYVTDEVALEIIDTWLETAFSEAPRHVRRIHEVEELYG